MKKLAVVAVLSLLSVLALASTAYANGHQAARTTAAHVLTYSAAHNSSKRYAKTVGQSLGDQMGIFIYSGVQTCDRTSRLRFDCVIEDEFQQPDYSNILCTLELNVFTTDRRFRIITVNPFVKTADCQNVGGLV